MNTYYNTIYNTYYIIYYYILYEIYIMLYETGTAVTQWLRCCATNRKVGVSIPAGVIGIFH